MVSEDKRFADFILGDFLRGLKARGRSGIPRLYDTLCIFKYLIIMNYKKGGHFG